LFFFFFFLFSKMIERPAAAKPRSDIVKPGLKVAMRLFLKNQTELNEQLMKNAREGKAKMVKKLLTSNRLDVNHLDGRFGATTLYFAAQRNHLEVVALLLAHPLIDVNLAVHAPFYPSPYPGIPQPAPLQQLLIDDAKLPSKSYITPLHIAAARGHTEVVKLLLAHPKIDVNLISNQLSPLLVAIANGQKAVFKLLLAHPKIDINLKSTHQVTPRYSLTILPAGLSPGSTPLLYACETGAAWAAELLLMDPKVKLDAKNRAGLTANEVAMFSRDPDICKLFGAQPPEVN